MQLKVGQWESMKKSAMASALNFQFSYSTYHYKPCRFQNRNSGKHYIQNALKNTHV